MSDSGSCESEPTDGIRECPDCHLEVDIILKSSDGVQFAAHAQNLERFSEGFPPATFTSTPTLTPPVVQLEENSRVVELLLQYMHLKPQPNIEHLPFKLLERLANAVEKYLIFSAMVVCRMCMRDNVSSYPLHVLRYAAKHGYKALADSAAKQTISKDFKEMKEFFGTNSQVIYLWLAYREPWIAALPLVYSKDPPIAGLHKGGLPECELWKPFYMKVLREVECSASQMARFESIVLTRARIDLILCDRCVERAQRWSSSVKQKIGDVPSFSDYL